MLAFSREIIVKCLLDLSEVMTGYQRNEGDFVAAALGWIGAVEAELKRLRSPLTSLCASERGILLAARDGIVDGRTREPSPRKVVRASAASCLGRIERALRERVADIDERLLTAAEKVAQLLAVGSTQIDLPTINDLADGARLAQVWQRLGTVAETRGLHGYLAALLSASDREYLVHQALGNVLAEQGELK